MNTVSLEKLYTEHVRIRQEEAEAALAAEGFDTLIIGSGAPMRYHADDQDVPFWPTPHFAHWLPLQEPHALLVVRPGEKSRLVRVVPDDFWEEHRGVADEFWAGEFDIIEVKNEADAWSAAGHIANAAYVGDAPAAATAAGVPEQGLNPLPLLSRLDLDRTRKSAYEVECLSKANERAAKGHIAARDAFLAGASELAIHHAFMHAVECTEDELPYGTIVALDEKAAILHYQHKRREAGGRILLLDAGAPFHSYGSDITRTYVKNADSLFVELVRGVERLQQKLCDELKPGVAYADFHTRAHVLVGTLLQELGVLRMSAEEAVEKNIIKTFFPHGIGHMLGVQVHDVGGKERHAAAESEYPMLRATRAAEEGHVFTVEPGIYFIPMLLSKLKEGPAASSIDWTLVERLAPSGGVRIEDNVLIMKGGARNLTREHLP